MCNIGAVTHCCFDCINKCHLSYFIYIYIYASDRTYGLDWIGLDLEHWTHVHLWLILVMHQNYFTAVYKLISRLNACTFVSRSEKYRTRSKNHLRPSCSNEHSLLPNCFTVSFSL